MDEKIKSETILQVSEIEWTEIKRREMSEEELDELWNSEDEPPYYTLDCKLPEDGQIVLLTIEMVNGDLGVACDTFCQDGEGSYFEDWDWDDIIAWAPMPEPFKP